MLLKGQKKYIRTKLVKTTILTNFQNKKVLNPQNKKRNQKLKRIKIQNKSKKEFIAQMINSYRNKNKIQNYQTK